MRVYYLSQGKLYQCESGSERYLPCGAVENYRRNLSEIQKRNEWKSSGTGAVFMGVAMQNREDPSLVYAQVQSFNVLDPDKLVYAAALESNSGLYVKNPALGIESEGFIIRQNDTRIYETDYHPEDHSIIASVSDGMIERHLALYHAENTSFRILTEGQAVDIMPSFSKKNRDKIVYSSAGFYVDHQRGSVHYSGYGVYALELSSGEIREVLSDERYDFIRARENEQGELYFIRRLKEAGEKRTGIKDVLLAPFRVIKALFGWLNFFTQRYAGESLTKDSGGQNPSKYSNKSEKEIFIDGNMVNVEKALKENALAGEKHPGIAPKSWELMRMDHTGRQEVIKKGVIDYAFAPDGTLVFSNGKYIIQRRRDGEEELLCKADVAVNLIAVPD